MEARILICLPYCLRDQEITLKLLEWIQELGGCHNHDLLLCRDARCPENIVQPILSTARATFKSVKDLIAKAEIDGWPEGANYFFRLCASEISHMRGVRYFFWMEPDTIPLKEGWLDQLDAEFIRCKKPFMGDLVEVENVPRHMSGIGFYPSPLHEFAGEAYRAFDLAFDMAGRDQIVPQAHFTDLIEHAWKHPSFTNDSELDTQISKEAVIFHASKDGSLISLLRGRKSPPVQPLEPSPAKESVSLSMDSPSSNSLSGGVESRHAKRCIMSGEREAQPRQETAVLPTTTSGSSAPPAQNISCDIFIRTYHGDYQWLVYCLKSIEKFATGFRKVWVVSPEDIPFSAASSGFEWKKMNEECDDHYLSQQIHKLYADVSTDYQADHILHIDSDTVFTRPVTPDDFLENGKVVWPYTPYDKIETPWQPITEKFMCRPVANEFMRRFPIMVPRWLYPKLREFCYHWHKVTIGDYIKRQPLRAFSEFNALGAYAFEYHRDKLEWVNTIEKSLPEPFARQFHSWGGLTPEVKQELEQIFSRKIEPEENSGGRTNEVGTASLNIPAETILSGSVVTTMDEAPISGSADPSAQNLPKGIRELPNGIWIIKDDTHIGKWVEQQGRLDHDMNTLPFILPLIKDGDVVVDAGAFIGDHTIAYSRAVGSKGTVHAFEPNPIAYQCLEHNMKKCGNVIMHDVGLGDKSGSIPLSGNNHNYGGCYAGTHMKIADVSVVTLDQLLDDEWVNFIKLDIEGYEPKALQGMVKTIERCHPKMVIEINQIALERQNCFPSKIFNFLKGHDYEWKILQDNCNEDSPMYDILAVASAKKLVPSLPQNGINEQGLLLTHQQDHDPITEVILAVSFLKEFCEADPTNRQRVMMRLSKANLIPRNTKKYGKKKKNKMAERTSSVV